MSHQGLQRGIEWTLHKQSPISKVPGSPVQLTTLGFKLPPAQAWSMQENKSWTAQGLRWRSCMVGSFHLSVPEMAEGRLLPLKPSCTRRLWGCAGRGTA